LRNKKTYIPRFLKALFGLFVILLINSEGAHAQDYCQLTGSVYVETSSAKAMYMVYIEESEAFAQLRIFKEDNKLYANKTGSWYFTEQRSFADFSVFFTTEREEADFTIYYTETESFAGCQ
jgi:hypothetical protein